MNDIEVPVKVISNYVYLTSNNLKELGIEELKEVESLNQGPTFISDISLTCGDIELKVIGPCRFYSQICLNKSTANLLGINPPVRYDGRLWDCPSMKVKYNGKSIELPVTIKKRTLFSDMELPKGSYMAMVNKGQRKGVLGNIEYRPGDGDHLELYIDEDEANAYDLKTGDTVSVRLDEQNMFYEPDGYEYLNEYITNV